MVGESHARRALDAFGFLKDMTCSYIFQGFKLYFPMLNWLAISTHGLMAPLAQNTPLKSSRVRLLRPSHHALDPQVGEGHPEGQRDSFPAVIFFSEPCVVWLCLWAGWYRNLTISHSCMKFKSRSHLKVTSYGLEMFELRFTSRRSLRNCKQGIPWPSWSRPSDLDQTCCQDAGGKKTTPNDWSEICHCRPIRSVIIFIPDMGWMVHSIPLMH